MIKEVLYHKLGNCCKAIRSGQTFKGPLEGYRKGDLTVLIPRDVCDGNINPEALRVDPDEVPSLQNHLLKKGELLIVNKGTKFNTFLYNGSPSYTVATTSFYVITPGDNLLPEYLNWYINQKDAKDYLASNAKGSVIPTITKTILSDLPVPVIPMDEQHYIYDFIEASKIEEECLKKLFKKKAEFTDSYIWERIQQYNL